MWSILATRAAAGLAMRRAPCASRLFATMHAARSHDTILDKEKRRQQAQDDIHEEVTEHSRKVPETDNYDDMAPVNERLDPTLMPDLYPDFDAEAAESDDSWYVDPEFTPQVPLWQRRMREAHVEAPLDASLFDLCRAVLEASASVDILDVADRCDWTSRMVVAETKSARHMHALAEDLLKAIKERNRQRGVQSTINVDGRESDDWMVVDLGSFVVHLMTPEAHKTYDLVKLWSDTRTESES
ncbi:hypothetical protein H4218_003379 [Coemansia sp. IMI 209128]|uniref:Uncharacterized protein n=1 Tax=Coemansia linderi TaxID=2663919 RepID=A0ACC1KJT3_9FUNG|nr:hypothetical protein GGI10_002217 [Coemansia sp. RSA 2530]KAJ2698296.1 hypothetical protein H4218_003379 [Coemansia sp. IMI 209128]KAJ2790756.1 hypothetical protein GGI18_001596 [Coemansia linderi]